jgi:hypothetical protein
MDQLDPEAPQFRPVTLASRANEIVEAGDLVASSSGRKRPGYCAAGEPADSGNQYSHARSV